jgi:peptidoglycan/xylan/chitin deacetylase (PgdA/CDA1 family)
MAFLCLPLSATGKAVILDYHSFLGTGKSGLDYSEKELGDQLDAISALGYKFVSLDDAVAGRIEGSANIVVTIDDGNHSVYRAVKDVFEPRGIKPFLFIYPAVVMGRSRYALSAEQLKELAADGCGIGAHGFYHNPMSEKALARNPKSFEVEIKRPGPALEKILGARPTLFAYPFGVYAKRAEEELAENGYGWAFAADDKIRQVSFDDPALDRMAVPRTITYRYLRKPLLAALKHFLDCDAHPSPLVTVPPEAPETFGPPAERPGEVAR